MVRISSVGRVAFAFGLFAAFTSFTNTHASAQGGWLFGFGQSTSAGAPSFGWGGRPRTNAAVGNGWGSGWGSAGTNATASGRQVVAFSKAYTPGQIIVSFGDRRLYYIQASGVAISYPIAVPRAQSRWSGQMRVSSKKVNPTWTPTPEMRRENPRLPAFVAGGDPRNPLGNRALYLGSTLYRIHGTDAPWTIGEAVSKGCVRMHNEHVLDLYPRVSVGAQVTVTWDRYTNI